MRALTSWPNNIPKISLPLKNTPFCWRYRLHIAQMQSLNDSAVYWYCYSPLYIIFPAFLACVFPTGQLLQQEAQFLVSSVSVPWLAWSGDTAAALFQWMYVSSCWEKQHLSRFEKKEAFWQLLVCWKWLIIISFILTYRKNLENNSEIIRKYFFLMLLSYLAVLMAEKYIVQRKGVVTDHYEFSLKAQKIIKTNQKTVRIVI